MLKKNLQLDGTHMLILRQIRGTLYRQNLTNMESLFTSAYTVTIYMNVTTYLMICLPVCQRERRDWKPWRKWIQMKAKATPNNSIPVKAEINFEKLTYCKTYLPFGFGKCLQHLCFNWRMNVLVKCSVSRYPSKKKNKC